MNYYDEILNEIQDLISEEKYDEAKSIILNELNISYVPKDVETKLYELLDEIKSKTFVVKELKDEQIEEFLKMDENHQLLAVDALNKKNLREYIDLCQNYLLSDGYVNAKVLLIDSLIRQEINYEFKYKDNSFNPRNLIRVEESEGFIEGINNIRDKFMKNPSMMKMAEQLMYKEAILSLPNNLHKDDGIALANKIEKYILDAFNSAN